MGNLKLKIRRSFGLQVTIFVSAIVIPFVSLIVTLANVYGTEMTIF